MTRMSFKNYNVPKEELPLFRKWNLHRAQAKYRNEAHELDWPEFRELWIDKLDENGNPPATIMLTRIHRGYPWKMDNVCFKMRSVGPNE